MIADWCCDCDADTWTGDTDRQCAVTFPAACRQPIHSHVVYRWKQPCSGCRQVSTAWVGAAGLV